jgi:DNA polymerase III delta prime subunit
MNLDVKGVFNGIWCEKYRPHTLNDIILDDRTLDIIKGFKSEIPNLLFVGNPGVGKTSLARIIVNDILKCNYLYINASDESGIDTIRHNITNFAQTKSFDGGIKVVILDEGDSLTSHAQAALRNTMESYSKTTRFILTGNYKHKIIPALQSRCQSIEIKPVIEAAVRRCYSILKSEDITVSEEQKKKFIELVKVNFPDIRKTINELQKNCVDKELCIENIHVDSELLKNIYNHITNKDVIALRKYLIENESRFNSDYDNLLVELLEHIYAQNIDDLRKKKMISIIADHLYKSSFVTDKEINCFACFITLELC